jgi:hypothetical protein
MAILCFYVMKANLFASLCYLHHTQYFHSLCGIWCHRNLAPDNSHSAPMHAVPLWETICVLAWQCSRHARGSRRSSLPLPCHHLLTSSVGAPILLCCCSRLAPCLCFSHCPRLPCSPSKILVLLLHTLLSALPLVLPLLTIPPLSATFRTAYAMPHPLDREVISDAELEIHAGLLAASYVSKNFDGLARTVHHVKTLSCVAGAHLEKFAAQLKIAMGYHSQIVQEIWTEPQDRTTLSTYVTSCHAVSNRMRSFNILQDTMNNYMEVLARQKELADRLQTYSLVPTRRQGSAPQLCSWQWICLYELGVSRLGMGALRLPSWCM